MLVAFSITDIMTFPEFAGMTRFDVLQPKNDEVIGKLLWELGANVDKGVFVQACKHRKFSGEMVTDYRYAYMERTDREWVRSGKASVSMLIETQRDGSLARELSQLWQEGASEALWKIQCQGAAKVKGKGTGVVVAAPQTEKDEAEVVALIRALQEAQKGIRGPLHDGEDVLIN
jgi:hypothetical protein